MSVRELRNWFSGDAQVPIECDICGANLDFEQQGVEWERIEVCNDCKQKALHFEENLNKMVTRTIELIGRCSKCGGELEGALGSMFKCKECGHIMDPEELKNQFLKEE